MIKVRALQNFDDYTKGTEVELPPEYAKGVIYSGLAVAVGGKAAPSHDNKMASEPENKTGRGRRTADKE